MNKRKLFSLAVMFFLGTAFGIYQYPLFLLFAALLLLVVRGKGKRRRMFCALLSAVFLIGAFYAILCLGQRQKQAELLSAAETFSCFGRIYKKEVREDQIIYYMDKIQLAPWGQENLKGSILLYPNPDTISKELKTDSRVYVRGKPTEFRRARNEGNFDEKIYYESLGFLTKVYADCVETVRVPDNPWKEKLYQLKCRWKELYAQTLPGEEAGVMCSVALGDKTFLDSDVKSMYQAAGIAHILAISGLHVSVVAFGVYRLLRKAGVGFVPSTASSAVLLFLFVQMSGMSASTVRAAGMFLMYLLAEILGEAYDSLTALGVMAVLLLLSNPFYVQNSGFLFSFGSVLGVCLAAQPLKKACQNRRREKRLEKYRGDHRKTVWQSAQDFFAENVWLSLGIQLFTMPMTAYFYYELPVYSIFLNLCILPFLSPLLGLGLIAGMVSESSMTLAKALLYPCHLILYGYEVLCDLSLSWPGARQILGEPSAAVLIFYYFCLFAALYLFSGRTSLLSGKGGWPAKNGWRGMLLGTALIALFWPHPAVCGLDILDVGQGDGIFIQSREGVNFFVDGGSTSEKLVGTFRILPFLKKRGVKGIDYWFLSHLDEDHTNGFIECVEANYPVETLILAQCVMESEDERLERILSLADEHGISVRTMTAGEICGTKTLTLECLYPGIEDPYRGANENSLVLLLRTEGFCGLLTGDIGEEQEQLLAERGLREKMEQESFVFLKAAHHGANGSNSRQLLKECGADLAVISCAKHNSYGHPGKKALVRMRKENLPVRITMDTGQIKIRIEKTGKVWYNSIYETD